MHVNVRGRAGVHGSVLRVLCLRACARVHVRTCASVACIHVCCAYVCCLCGAWVYACVRGVFVCIYMCVCARARVKMHVGGCVHAHANVLACAHASASTYVYKRLHACNKKLAANATLSK